MTLPVALSAATPTSAASSLASAAVTTMPVDGHSLLSAVTGPGAAAFVILLIMSQLCWYLIVVRLVALLRRKRLQRDFYGAFAATSDRQGVALLLEKAPESALQRLTSVAWFGWQQGDQIQSVSADQQGQWLVGAIQDQLAKERLRLESGLTLMACVGACAPFVGLFGTVWGIFHALQVIGMSGQSSLDKVAGPVGETLIMTGLGLLVALPAVLAYNSFVRLNRREISWLESFAQQLHSLVLWEVRLTPPLLSKGVLPQWFAKEGV